MKTCNLTQTSLRKIQLIAGCMAFHSGILKTKMAFKMWFLFILSINFWFQMLLRCGNVSRSEINWWMLELWCLSSSISLKKSKGSVFVAKNTEFIEETMHNRRMRWFITINGQDCASLYQNGAIKSHSSDQRWRLEMRLRCVKKEARRFIASTWCSLGG